MCASRLQNTWKGLAAGLVGGLVASWTMNQFQSFLSKMQKKSKSDKQSENSSQRQGKEQQEEGEDATMKAADKLWEEVAGSPLSKKEKKTAGPIVHYVFGSTMGAVYGAVVEHVPWGKAGVGIPFGTLLFVGADEVAVPALGFSKSPPEYPLSAHATALAAHVVYGVTTEVVRRMMRAAM
jgi:hypothetical protein